MIPAHIREAIEYALAEAKKYIKDSNPNTFIAEWRQAELDKFDAALEWLEAQDAPRGEALDLQREMLAMIDELLVLAHRPEHSWDEKDYELRDRIAARHIEMVAQLKDGPAPAPRGE